MSTTATVPLEITCPDWCEETPQHHANELWNMDGRCYHSALLVAVDDPTGQGPDYNSWDDDRFESRLIPVGLSVATRPDGASVATPGIRLGEDFYTIEQIEYLTDELRKVVALAKRYVPGSTKGGAA